MSIKQKFAKTLKGYSSGFGEVVGEGPELLLMMGIFTGIIGVGIGGFGAGGVMDAMDRMDNTPQIGQEISIQQHQEALANLAEQRATLDKMGGYTPAGVSALQNLIDIPEDAQQNRAAMELQNQIYHSLLNDFVTSVHLDTRLNEADVKSLTEQFEATHGQVEDVTPFDNGIDYADIMESRARADGGTYDTEFDKAKGINNMADGFSWNNFSTGGALGLFLFPWLLAIAGGLAHKPLDRWSREQPAKKGFNH
ncbi:MAG: hypothetical protein EP349_08975 [Alphaproteobacteria bacterium]|nr:MAG: hypothetical protein EP349_08975 [Alphaproteobacteria bacterium]